MQGGDVAESDDGLGVVDNPLRVNDVEQLDGTVAPTGTQNNVNLRVGECPAQIFKTMLHRVAVADDTIGTDALLAVLSQHRLIAPVAQCVGCTVNAFGRYCSCWRDDCYPFNAQCLM